MHAIRGRPEIAERHGAGHVARCTVERLMGDLGLRGVRRAKSTCSAPREQCPADLVRRHFEAFAPGGLWVADIPPLRGRCPLLRAYVLRVGLRRLRHRCLLAEDHRLADHLLANVHRPGPGRPSDGRLATKTSGADLTGLVHHFRPWGAVPVHSLWAGSGRLRGSRLGGVEGRFLSALLWPRRSTRCTRPS